MKRFRVHNTAVFVFGVCRGKQLESELFDFNFDFDILLGE